MVESIFADYIKKYFNGVTGKLTQSYNDRKQKPVYLIDNMTKPEFSVDGTWDSAQIKSSIIAADVVSLNSSLPLKKRDVLATAKGIIPKLGMKKSKKEDDIERINLMKAKGVKEAQVAEAIFSDVKTCPEGIQVRLEIMFEQAVSTGACMVDSNTKTGTGIRATYGYLAGNMLKASKVWGTSGYTPISDMKKMLAKARENGTKINVIMMSDTAFEQIRTSTEGKALWCNYAGLTQATQLAPNTDNMTKALAEEFKAEIIIVDSVFKVEMPDGTQKVVTPWESANIVALPEKQIGRIVYAQLAEETSKAAGVQYSKVGAYTLVSMYRTTDPLEEITAAQAKAIPVIDSAEDIIVLDTAHTA